MRGHGARAGGTAACATVHRSTRYARHRPEETLLYQQCARCGGRLKVLASIEERELIERILAHRRERVGEEAMTASLGARAPPQASLL